MTPSNIPSAELIRLSDIILRQLPYALIPVNRIEPDPDNARNEYDQAELQGLAEGYTVAGAPDIMVQPASPTVGQQLRVDEPLVKIIAGHRRWRAAMLAGLPEIGCRIRYGLTPVQVKALQLVENVQRADLSLAETCVGVRNLHAAVQEELSEAGDTRSALEVTAERVGKSKAWVSKRITVANLRSEVRELMTEGLVQDVEILHLLNRVAELAPDEFEQIHETYGMEEDARPTRDYLRGLVHDLELQAKIAEGEKAAAAEPPARAPASGDLFTAREDEPDEPNASQGLSHSRFPTGPASASPPGAASMQSGKPITPESAIGSRAVQANELGPKVRRFEQENNARVAELFKLPFDEARLFSNPLSITSHYVISANAPSLPASVDANEYDIRFKGTLSQLGDALTVLAAGTRVNCQLDLSLDDLRKVERALGHPVAFEATVVKSGQSIKAALLGYERATAKPQGKKAKAAPAKAAAVPQGPEHVQIFLKACTQRKKDNRVSTEDFCNAYKAWCKANGVEPLSTQHKPWADQIAKAGIGKDRSHGVRYYTGIQLQAEARS